MAYHILNGDFSKISKREQMIIEEIVNSDSNDVVVERIRDLEDEWSYIKTIGLQEDSSDWVNIAISNYYGKNTIKIKYIN